MKQSTTLKTKLLSASGRKNAPYTTLSQLAKWLGISADSLFHEESPDENKAIRLFMGKFQSCSPGNQKILLETLDFLAGWTITGLAT